MHFFQTKDELEFILFRVRNLIFASNPYKAVLSTDIYTQKLGLNHLERLITILEQLHKSNLGLDCKMVVIRLIAHKGELPYNNNQQDRYDQFYD